MIFRAPGRVDLIGEHTDYNQGFVLPIAIHLETTIETVRSSEFTAHSAQKNETVTFDLDQPAKHHWIDYIVGVARELQKRGMEIHPQSLHIESTVPEGAGLSSSAALEVATALALLEDRDLDRLEIARLCQRAESDFVGMPCGIMDQYVSLFGRDHAALKIDCRSLESEPVPLPDNVAILAVNSMVKHSLGQTAYRTRVAECQSACREFGVTSLRDATLQQARHNKRARHIITENQRVVDFVKAASANDLNRMGQLFVESHRSMRDDYEISCEEIDFLVDAAASLPGCYGARMTGGGFGGCTVNLVAPESVAGFTKKIRAEYRKMYRIEPGVIPCIPAPGAGKITETSGHGTH
jgi:galactokinase